MVISEFKFSISELITILPNFDISNLNNFDISNLNSDMKIVFQGFSVLFAED